VQIKHETMASAGTVLNKQLTPRWDYLLIIRIPTKAFLAMYSVSHLIMLERCYIIGTFYLINVT
jgi:hypothetical protein